jgi:hypothetical protein
MYHKGDEGSQRKTLVYLCDPLALGASASVVVKNVTVLA